MMSALLMVLAQGSGATASAQVVHPATPSEVAVIARGLQADLPGITASSLSDFLVSDASPESGEACGFVAARLPSEGGVRKHLVHVQLFADEKKAWHAYVFSLDDAFNRTSCEALRLAPTLDHS